MGKLWNSFKQRIYYLGSDFRFNDKLKSLLEREPYLSMSATQLYKKMVDYLFLVWQEGEVSVISLHFVQPCCADDVAVCDICRDGFCQPVSSVIWLTNSVNIADRLHLAQQSRVGQSRVGQSKLLLCKVFTGQAAETSDSGL
jgi:hypothetical protein